MGNVSKRSLGVLALTGAAIWLMTGSLGGERGTRALLNPAFILLLGGALGVWRLVRPDGGWRAWGVGFVVAGLLADLAGNWLEYGPFPSLSLPGWGIFLLGWLAVGPLGAILISFAEVRRPKLPGVARVGLLLLAVLPFVTLGAGVIIGGDGGPGIGIGGLMFGIGWALVGISLAGRPSAGLPASDPTAAR